MPYKKFIAKFFPVSMQAVTDAWDYSNNLVVVSSLLSISFSALIACFDSITRNYLGVSTTLFFMVVVIIVLDFIFGTLASIKGKRVFCAAKGMRSTYKLITYIVFLYCTHALIKEHHGSWSSTVIQWVHIYITIHIFFWESFSVNKNLKKLGVNLGLVEFFTTIFNIFQSKVKSEIDNLPK